MESGISGTINGYIIANYGSEIWPKLMYVRHSVDKIKGSFGFGMEGEGLHLY